MKLLQIGIRPLLLTSCVLVLFFATHGQTDASPKVNGYQIAGTVVDESGKPVEGVRISAMAAYRPSPGRLSSSFTDANGRFILTNVNAGHYLIMAEKEGGGYPDMSSLAYWQNTAVADLTEAQQQIDITIQLTRAPSITGSVKEAKSHVVVKDARIKTCLTEAPDKCARVGVNEDGAYRVFVPADKDFTFTVVSETHAEKKLALANEKGLKEETLRLKAGEKRNADFELERKQSDKQ